MVPSTAFAASTGRTATQLMAKTLNLLPCVRATHEGHVLTDKKLPVLPLINIHNRKAWHDAAYAKAIVDKTRSSQHMEKAAGGASLCIDIAFYNAPLMTALTQKYPNSSVLIIFRRCESFVRSATVIDGEDLDPVGWPDPDKALTSREEFMAMGRLKPKKTSADAKIWDQWSGISRNIWLWVEVNKALFNFSLNNDNCRILYYEDLQENTEQYWTGCLQALNQLTPTNLDLCISHSKHKINARKSYDIGEYSTWNHDEQQLFRKLADPLETQIYGQ